MARLDLQSSADGARRRGVHRRRRQGDDPELVRAAGRPPPDGGEEGGFKTFTDWFELQEGERRTRDVVLERAEAPTGTLLVNSDAGGEVYVDGQRKDVAPAIIPA